MLSTRRAWNKEALHLGLSAAIVAFSQWRGFNFEQEADPVKVGNMFALRGVSVHRFLTVKRT